MVKKVGKKCQDRGKMSKTKTIWTNGLTEHIIELGDFDQMSRLFYPEKIIRSGLYILEYFTLTEIQIQTLKKRSKIQRTDNGMAKIKGQKDNQ